MSYTAFQRVLATARAAGNPYADFRNVMALCFRHLPGSPAPTPMQYDFGRAITTGADRAVFELPRGWGKSTITGMLPAWAWTFYPDLKFMVPSGEASLAQQMTTFVLHLLREETRFQHLYPRSDQRSSMTAFDVDGARAHRDFSIRSVGILGRMTGGHADWILPDDVEVPNTSDTVGMRDKLRTRYEELEAIVNTGGRITPIGTPHTDETLYVHLMNQGYDMTIYPARAPGGNYAPRDRYGSALAPYITDLLDSGRLKPDQPTDPGRLDEDTLLKKEALYRPAGFALQYMLDPSMADAAKRPLKLNDLIVADVDMRGAPARMSWGSDKKLWRDDVPCLGTHNDHYHRPSSQEGEFTEWGGVTMWVDPAGAGRDETAYAVVAVLHGQLYLLDWGGTQDDGKGDNVMEWLAKKARENRVREVQVEDNFGNGMYAKLLGPVLRAHWPCSLESVPNKGNKAKRILDALEPTLRQHRLTVSADALRREALEARHSGTVDATHRTLAYQLSRMTHDGHAIPFDDRLEAVACAVRRWSSALDVDALEMAKQAVDDEDEKWIEEGCPMLGEAPSILSGSWYQNKAVREQRC